uniref:Uncharacterized protein n=1 Tax=Trichogramma kaykai TaxID=54128 RepID=A0ABD2X294_9HYME
MFINIDSSNDSTAAELAEKILSHYALGGFSSDIIAAQKVTQDSSRTNTQRPRNPTNAGNLLITTYPYKHNSVEKKASALAKEKGPFESVMERESELGCPSAKRDRIRAQGLAKASPVA